MRAYESETLIEMCFENVVLLNEHFIVQRIKRAPELTQAVFFLLMSNFTLHN